MATITLCIDTYPAVMSDVRSLTGVLRDSKNIVAFTGAGISTESGIPDFRSPGGVWTRYDPREFTFDRFVESAEAREKSWHMRREFFDLLPEPNPGHRALASLEEAGRMMGVITQNIDGLHQEAGSRNVIEIHGTARDVQCIGTDPGPGEPNGCGFTASHQWAMEHVDAGETDPRCPHCGGLIKSATISFGQALSPEAMDAAADLAARCDTMLSIGSSLQVYPAAGIPLRAKEAGAVLVIINDEETPLDDVADIVIRGKAGETLEPAVAALRSAES